MDKDEIIHEFAKAQAAIGIEFVRALKLGAPTDQPVLIQPALWKEVIRTGGLVVRALEEATANGAHEGRR